MVRQKLVEVVETLDFESLRLRELFSFTLDQTIGFLVNAGALKNEAYCNKCRSKMNIQKRKKNHDGIWWVCRNGKEANCSTKSIRTGSFFKNSNLTLPTSLLLLYMWATDFDNKHVVRELDLSPKTVVD